MTIQTIDGRIYGVVLLGPDTHGLLRWLVYGMTARARGSLGVGTWYARDIESLSGILEGA